jgi:hypothetical protein
LKYCSYNKGNKYELTLINDGSGNALYKLFNSNGVLIKVVNGKWSIKDEGFYGNANKLTFENSTSQSMKFLCQYDGYGNLQNLIDSLNVSWFKCK